MSRPLSHNVSGNTSKNHSQKFPESSSSVSYHASLMQNVGSPKSRSNFSARIANGPQQADSINHQNLLLREQNYALKKELNSLKLEASGSSGSRHKTILRSEDSDLRETIKKDISDLTGMKTRIEVLSKQCRMYEVIIEKMQAKISRLTQENKVLEKRLTENSIEDIRTEEQGNRAWLRKTIDRQKFDPINKRVDEIFARYSELEDKFQRSEEQWEHWKDQWAKQKTYYLRRVRDLEELMGIGEGIKIENKSIRLPKDSPKKKQYI